MFDSKSHACNLGRACPIVGPLPHLHIAVNSVDNDEQIVVPDGRHNHVGGATARRGRLDKVLAQDVAFSVQSEARYEAVDGGRVGTVGASGGVQQRTRFGNTGCLAAVRAARI